MEDYRFRGKDPVIDIMRTVVQAYAAAEGLQFKKACKRIERDSHGLITFATLKGWFYGKTRYPAYFRVARLYVFLKRYARVPVTIGDTGMAVRLRVVK